MSIHSIQTADGFIDNIVLKEWEFYEGDVINGIWGVAKALEQELVQLNDNEEVAQCLSIALVNLASQLKDSQ